MFQRLGATTKKKKKKALSPLQFKTGLPLIT